MDLLAIGAPDYDDLAPPTPRIVQHEHLRWGKFYICEALPCGPGDECFAVSRAGLAGFEKLSFLRRFPKGELAVPLIANVRLHAFARARGIEQILELATHEDHAYIESEYVGGISVDRMISALRARRQQLPWPIALAMFFDAYTRVSQLRDIGILHGDLTPSRLRMSWRGLLYICHGLPRTRGTWPRMLCDAALPILKLAATDEEATLLTGVLRGADSDASLAIASDALILRHPELDPLLPALLLSALDGSRVQMERVGSQLAQQLDTQPLWQLVAELVNLDKLATM